MIRTLNFSKESSGGWLDFFKKSTDRNFENPQKKDTS